ncbi:MAG: hypothetical protein KDD45_04870 [Bdellovibrionales bacterium]|nr:hypothetical protein [Bdellovibrionales bacterium]
MRGNILFLVFTLLLGFQLSHAKQFKNAYISFEVPERWACQLEATEWVCRSQDTNEAKEAIIILTAKEVGPSDSLAIYENHLKKPIPAALKTGGTIMSQVVTAPQQKQINNLIWIDGFHLSSEIQNYYTRYLATIKDKIAVLVTFSAHKDFYSKYATDLFKAINSLNVIATKNSLGSDPSIQGPGGSLGAISTGQGGANFPQIEPISPKEKKSNKLIFLALALVLGGIGVFLLLKMKKK